MPNFKYTAKNLQGQTIRGAEEAADEHALAASLRDRGLFLLNQRDITREEQNAYKLKSNEVADFCRQVGTMLGAGISLTRALNIMLQRDMKLPIKQVYAGVYKALQRGEPVSDAMAAQGRAFPELLIAMFRAGESSGQLEKNAMRMAVHYEKDHKLKNKVKSATTYPIILIVLSVLVMILVFTVILPSFFDLFEGIELPVYTRIVIAISNVLTNYWYVVLIVVLCLAAAGSLLLRQPKIRRGVDHLKLKLPKIGRLMKIICTARFARTLCSLYTSGMSMVGALRISADTVGNRYLSTQFENMIREVRGGRALSSAIRLVDGFDPKLASIIFVGEETGRLDDMLESVADTFDYESEEALQKLVTILEPLLIVVLAVMIGFVMVSVMVPIYTLYNNVGTLA